MKDEYCIMQDSEASFWDYNSACFCKKLALETPYDSYFAKTQVFLSNEIINSLKRSIHVLEKVITSELFKKSVFMEKYDITSHSSVSGGVLMSYDFHLDGNTPKLIEINTNAGGAFLNYELLKAVQSSCVQGQKQNIENFENDIVSMFKNEFSQKSVKELKTILLVDENPTQQFLYPEFLLCKNILEKKGFTVFIADPKDITIENGSVIYEGVIVDMIYNRLTDFYFSVSDNQKLIEALKNNMVVISPNANDHQLFADKVNFLKLGDMTLTGAILQDDECLILKNTLLETKIVDTLNIEYLWANRKKYFFKPFNGFGGRGAYNGRGLTKQVWENIKNKDYLAQEIVPANIRITKNEAGDETEAFKFDIRAYTYKGEVLLLAARMYQGQTTNFRTAGGGFAPIMITDK